MRGCSHASSAREDPHVRGHQNRPRRTLHQRQVSPLSVGCQGEARYWPWLEELPPRAGTGRGRRVHAQCPGRGGLEGTPEDGLMGPLCCCFVGTLSSSPPCRSGPCGTALPPRAHVAEGAPRTFYSPARPLGSEWFSPAGEQVTFALQVMTPSGQSPVPRICQNTRARTSPENRGVSLAEASCSASLSSAEELLTSAGRAAGSGNVPPKCP